jgi:hypothetical protein
MFAFKIECPLEKYDNVELATLNCQNDGTTNYAKNDRRLVPLPGARSVPGATGAYLEVASLLEGFLKNLQILTRECTSRDATFRFAPGHRTRP